MFPFTKLTSTRSRINCKIQDGIIFFIFFSPFVKKKKKIVNPFVRGQRERKKEKKVERNKAST